MFKILFRFCSTRRLDCRLSLLLRFCVEVFVGCYVLIRLNRLYLLFWLSLISLIGILGVVVEKSGLFRFLSSELAKSLESSRLVFQEINPFIPLIFFCFLSVFCEKLGKLYVCVRCVGCSKDIGVCFYC